MSLATIESLCSKYSAAANALNDRVVKLNKKRESGTQAAKPEIDTLTKQCIKTRTKLKEAIRKSPQLFEEPRTYVFSGIKVGFALAPDSLDIDNAKTVDLILRKMPEQKATLIKTTHKVVQAALKNLDDRQLKIVGVTRIDGVDNIVLKAADSAVNKVVEAHLKNTKF